MPTVASRLDEIERKLIRIISMLTRVLGQGEVVMADLTQLTTEVNENQDAIASAVTLLHGLKEALDAAGTDPVALAALSQQLSDNTDALAAAVVANTPVEPA